MPFERIGFANRNADGTWSPIHATEANARRASRGAPVDRAQLAVPVWVDAPVLPPRPIVVLAATGERVRWNPARDWYVIETAGGLGRPVPTLVALVKLTTVADADLDALQALPARTAAWTAAGGRD